MIPVIGTAIGKVLDIVDKFIPDKALAAKLRHEILLADFKEAEQEMKARMEVIKTEATSVHWVVAAWRPVLMLLFGAIIANNYLIYPYLKLFFPQAPILEIPPDMWALLKIGIGGYVIGRSGEKIMRVWRQNGGD